MYYEQQYKYFKMTSSITMIFVILVSSFIPFTISFYQGGRLKCLQSEFGNEPDTTEQWIQGKVSKYTNTTWIYNNPRCPFSIFDEKKFCKKSIGCGNTILFVGDSTVLHWTLASDLLFKKKSVAKPCPSHKCRPMDKHCRQDREIFMDYATICDRYCPSNLITKMIFIRHNFLINKHGNSYLITGVCDHWFKEAEKADIIVLSTGPHIVPMIHHPYRRNPPANFSMNELFRTESQHLATTLTQIIKPSAVVVYRTGSIGVGKYSRDCDLKPLRHTPPIATNYSWNLIPGFTKIYIESLTSTLSKQLLVMNSQFMMHEWVGCRLDGIHFNYQNPKTPILLEWQLLHNLLLEYRK